MKLLSPILFGILLCLTSTFSHSQISGTLFSATKDSYLNSGSVSNNYETSTLTYAGRFSGKSGYATCRTVVEFDFSSIPPNAIVTLATLRMNESASSGSPVTYTGRLKTSWSESTITWANQPAYETTDLITSSSIVSGGWLEIDVQEHVQKMVAGVCDNNGWLLLNNNETVNSNVSRTFRSRENSSTLLRPQLVVEYYLPIEVTSALIVHASSDEAEDGSISPTLGNGPEGLSYKWYNSEDSVVSTSLNLEDVPYGWYGLEVASSNVDDTFYHAFIVGVDCDVVDIEFITSPKYTSNATVMTGIPALTTINFGNAVVLMASKQLTLSMWVDIETLLKFNLWIDSEFTVNKADLTVYGADHYSSARSNESTLDLITEYWDENIVTWHNQPAYSDSISILLDSTLTTNQNRILDMIPFWNFWKTNDNAYNHGVQLRLLNYIETAIARQVYHSPNAASSANYPKIDFTLDLRKPPVVMAWDTIAQAGELFINLNNVCGKTAPYKYMIAQDSIPDLGDLYSYINDSIFSGELDSTTFFSGTNDLTKLYEDLSSGTYYITVFDSSWNRIVDEEIHVQKEFSFSSQTGLITSEDTIISTQNDAIGSLEMYVHEGLTGHLKSQFVQLGGTQYIGFSEIDSTVSSYEDLEYGFYIQNDTVYTLTKGIPSMSYTLIDTTALLTMYLADTILCLSIDSDTVFMKVLDSGFAYKTDVGLQNEKSLILKPFKLPYLPPRARFRGNVVQHLTCSGDPGSFQFKVGIPYYLGGPFSIDYDVEDEDSNPVVTGGTATAGVYEDITEYEGTQDPLLPGTYKITGTVNTIPVHWFEGYITLGYEADWNQVIDYDQTPNSYSLLRTLPTVVGYNYQEASFAGTKNFLQSGNEGWAQFTSHRQSQGTEFVRFSTLNISSMSPLVDEDLIVLGNFGNLNILLWLIDGNLGISFIPPGFFPIGQTNADIRLEFDPSNNVTIKLNGSPIAQEPSVVNRVLRFQTLPQNNGFRNIITSFPCPTQGLDKMSHAELRRQLDGGYTHAVEGTLLFTFDEEYDTEATQYVALNIYDETYELEEHINFGGTSYSGTAPDDYEFDDNKRALDISGLALNIGEFYILEVVTSKGEKLYLRFLYKS